MSIAYGCAVYNDHKNVTLNEIIKMSDKNMYENYCKNKELTYYDFNSMINDIKNELAS